MVDFNFAIFQEKKKQLILWLFLRLFSTDSDVLSLIYWNVMCLMWTTYEGNYYYLHHLFFLLCILVIVLMTLLTSKSVGSRRILWNKLNRPSIELTIGKPMIFVFKPKLSKSTTFCFNSVARCPKPKSEIPWD